MYRRDNNNFFNEEKFLINSLSSGSGKFIISVCPLCGREKENRYCDIITYGHTYCRCCSILRKTVNSVMGKTFGRLTVVEFYKPHLSKNGKLVAQVLCQCSCGNKSVAQVKGLKSGKRISCGCIKKELNKRTGKNHPTFNHDISDEKRKDAFYERRTAEIKQWKKNVLDIFGERCFLCGSQNKIEVHHIENFNNNEKLRHSVQNGVCLCRLHHHQYHYDFLGGSRVPATKQSFRTYMEWWLCQLQNF